MWHKVIVCLCTLESYDFIIVKKIFLSPSAKLAITCIVSKLILFHLSIVQYGIEFFTFTLHDLCVFSIYLINCFFLFPSGLSTRSNCCTTLHTNGTSPSLWHFNRVIPPALLWVPSPGPPSLYFLMPPLPHRCCQPHLWSPLSFT